MILNITTSQIRREISSESRLDLTEAIVICINNWVSSIIKAKHKIVTMESQRTAKKDQD